MLCFQRNLQLAIGAYFDLTEESPSSFQHNSSVPNVAAGCQPNWHEEESWETVETQPTQQQPAAAQPENKLKTNAYTMSIIQDMSVTEDNLIPPRTRFVKQWKIQNTGNLAWPPGSHLRIISGNRSMVAQERIFINPQVQVWRI